MLNKNSFKRWVIKICRYVFRQQYLPVMAGPLKGFLWSTSASYDYILGTYEDPETLKYFLSWLKADSVFYDIGSNIGFHALTANQIIQTGKIYAFEPMPAMRKVMEKHVSLNSKVIITNNIELLPFAISNKAGRVAFSNDINKRDGNTYIEASYVFSGATGKIEVETQSIDGLMLQGYQKPDIIKIDAEGAEYDILLGSKETLNLFHPNILLATHDCHLPGVQEKCVHFLEELGYRLKHTGKHNKHMNGLDDYIAMHKSKPDN